MSHHGAQGTGGRWLLPTSWPAWPAYSSSRPDASGGYRCGRPRRPWCARVRALQATQGGVREPGEHRWTGSRQVCVSAPWEKCRLRTLLRSAALRRFASFLTRSFTRRRKRLIGLRSRGSRRPMSCLGRTRSEFSTRPSPPKGPPRRPTGPQGQKRPADMDGNAGHVMRIATGEIEEGTEPDDGSESATNFRVGPVAGCALTPTEPGRRGLCERSCFVCFCRAAEPPLEGPQREVTSPYFARGRVLQHRDRQLDLAC